MIHNGPFETDQQARELPAVRATYDAMHASHRRGIMGERNHRMLCEAASAAGVELGEYDHHILLWLSNWEPETIAVIAGLISRAAMGRGSQAEPVTPIICDECNYPLRPCPDCGDAIGHDGYDDHQCEPPDGPDGAR